MSIDQITHHQMTGMENKEWKAAGRIVMVTAIMAFTKKDAVITQ